jgi:hypothetical protein
LVTASLCKRASGPFVCWRPPGRKRQAPSSKHQASSVDSWENIGYKVFGPSSPDSRAMWQWMVPNKKGERHMAQSYPIWIDVSGDNYKKDKSFGSRDSVTMDIKVGSSKTYSNDRFYWLQRHCVSELLVLSFAGGLRAASGKHQASSNKHQAPSFSKKERQASSSKHKGSSSKPQASSS